MLALLLSISYLVTPGVPDSDNPNVPLYLFEDEFYAADGVINSCDKYPGLIAIYEQDTERCFNVSNANFVKYIQPRLRVAEKDI